MPANVETMFSVREKPWHGLGTIVQDAPNSADALRMAGLDWEVIKKPVFLNSPRLLRIPDYFATVRSSDGSPLGIVGDHYKVVQNADAFAFTDALVANGDARYETAGSLAEGRRVWLLAQLPNTRILGDDVENYLCFANSHDGKGAVKVCITPVRVVCQNTLNLALSTAKRAWSTKHMGSMEAKMEEARNTLQLANTYITELAERAEQLAEKQVYDEQFETFLKTLFPLEDGASDRKARNVLELRAGVRKAYDAPDLADYKGTAWGIINAVSDMVYHSRPQRESANYKTNLWDKSIDGNAILDKACELIAA